MGTLTGVKVVEMAGIGPGPFCAMLLADMGADVVRIDRLEEVDRGVNFPTQFDLLNRNKRSVALDLKSEQGRATALDMIAKADILVEGFRPGVMEKLGLGPFECLAANPKLAYGRMTGWGQDGPLSMAAGHDVNYIAITGALHAIGRKGEAPIIPLNLLGDFGGGALYLAMGLLAAVIEARSSGTGQVVDAAIVDGVANLMTMQHAMKQMGMWSSQRGSNIIDGGAPFYDVYETLDGGFITVGAVEKRFFETLLELIGLTSTDLPKQNDPKGWDQLRATFAEVFKTRTRDQWCELLEGTDACFAPVLSMDEAATHPHNKARNIYQEIDGVLNPAPAPRFSKTPSSITRSAPKAGADTQDVLLEWKIG
jgi:alpha-methylacyl-CoA racemase